MKKYANLPIAAFALLSFVSIAVGNVLLGIATLCFLIYAVRNKDTLQLQNKTYYAAIGIL